MMAKLILLKKLNYSICGKRDMRSWLRMVCSKAGWVATADSL